MTNLDGVPANRAHAGLCHILIVDDDATSAAEYAEIASSLGYECVAVGDAREALRKIAEEPRIGIVVTDLQMPALDGLSFLDELSARYSDTQPIVAIMVTGHGSLELAVEAMRLGAADFLTKPVSYPMFSQALRRAYRKWVALSALRGGGAHGGVVVDEEPAVVVADLLPALAEQPVRFRLGLPSEEEMVTFVKGCIRAHERRGDFLDPELFTDPAFNILLDLALARLENKSLAVSSACVAAGVPMSTALRHIRILVEKGYARRWQDPNDRRRDLLMIEDRAMKGVTDYLTALWRRVNEVPTK